MTTIETPATSILDAARNAVPALRENGSQAEDDRWLPRENIDLLDRAGVFRMAVPGRFGGLDLPLADQFAVLREISRGCGSTGWTAATWVSTAWMISLYPDRAQEEVFARGTAKVSGAFTPSATLVPAEGGYVLDGSWRFNTGCRGADWNLVAAILDDAASEAPEMLFAVVPMSELEISDDWHVCAAGGTGSSTTTAKGVFVPAHRIANGEQALEGMTADRWNLDVPGRNYGLIGLVMAEAAAVYIGMATAALELFTERLPGRAIAYSNWDDQSRHPLTQISVATAENKIAAARALAAEVVDLLQRRADANVQPSIAERAAVRGRCGYVVQLAKEAVQVLHAHSGASALHRRAHFQRFYRDLEGLSLHGMMAASTNLEVHGRVILGLEPDTPVL
jgi:alkylation response protein AidB-like acyl-CoA dehydrogenase